MEFGDFYLTGWFIALPNRLISAQHYIYIFFFFFCILERLNDYSHMQFSPGLEGSCNCIPKRAIL